ncbi:MAG: hypothetical protein L6408_07665 [Nanoarchaeota archaeon]|nr:hypothetical protein [Nanoarchaeota archaeon]
MSEEYDIDLIIDTEGTEGLQKIYSGLSGGIITIRLSNLEWDFAINYFNSKYKEIINYLGLNSIFDTEIPGLTEDIREKFKRRETLWRDMGRADDVFEKTLKFNANDGKDWKRSYMNMQIVDSYMDVLTVKNGLDIAVKKGNAHQMQEVSIDNIIEDYGSLLKSYADNKKFMKKDARDQMRVIQKPLSDMTSERLEDVISSYNIHHENIEKHFQKLKDRILDTKDMPFGVMFEEQKEYGWQDFKDFCAIGAAVIASLPLLGGVAAAWILAMKAGLVFSSYITGGSLFMSTYLIAKTVGAAGRLGDKILAKSAQKVVDINTPLKNMIIDDKKVYKDIIP